MEPQGAGSRLARPVMSVMIIAANFSPAIICIRIKLHGRCAPRQPYKLLRLTTRLTFTAESALFRCASNRADRGAMIAITRRGRVGMCYWEVCLITWPLSYRIFSTLVSRGGRKIIFVERWSLILLYFVFKQTSYHLFIWVTLAELLMQLYKWKRNKRGPMFRN